MQERLQEKGRLRSESPQIGPPKGQEVQEEIQIDTLELVVSSDDAGRWWWKLHDPGTEETLVQSHKGYATGEGCRAAAGAIGTVLLSLSFPEDTLIPNSNVISLDEARIKRDNA